jgi:TRAP-type C4-dicarboxylate transport system substrate-binding protein
MVAFATTVTVILLTALSATYAAESIKLRYSNFMPATHRMSVLTGQFCEEIKKRTNGRVEITHYPGGTLTTAPKIFQGVVTGFSDFGWSVTNYNQGRFPVIDLTVMPIGKSDGWVASQVADDFYRKFTPKELDSVHVLFLCATGPNIIFTAKTAVRTLEDLKGVKIRATGKTADTLEALGGAPVPLEQSDTYEALRRGVIEGCLGPLEQLKGYRLGELAKYVTASWRVGSSNTFYSVMNKEKWNHLPADIKKIFDEVSMEFKVRHAQAWDEIDLEGLDFLKQHGGQAILLSEAEAKRWEKAVEPVIVNYKKDLMSKGYKGDEIDGWISYIRERVDFWEKKAKEQGIKSVWQ